MAVMVRLPVLSAEVLRLALPPLRATMPRMVEPSWKVIVPVGVPGPDVPATVAVKVTDWPKTACGVTDELITEISFPAANGPHRYEKFRRRLSDWAIVAVGAQRMEDGQWRVGITNASPTPVRARAMEQALAAGAPPADAARQASQGLDPTSDLRGSAEYKRHLAEVLAQRAVERAT